MNLADAAKKMHDLEKENEKLNQRLSQALLVGYDCGHEKKDVLDGDCVHCNLKVAEWSVLKLQKDVAVLRAPLEKIVDAKYARDSMVQELVRQLNERDERLSQAEAMNTKHKLDILDGVQAMQVLEARLSHLMDVAEKVKSFLREIAEDFDCDEDAHKYGTTCRACSAKLALAEWDGIKEAK